MSSAQWEEFFTWLQEQVKAIMSDREERKEERREEHQFDQLLLWLERIARVNYQRLDVERDLADKLGVPPLAFISSIEYRGVKISSKRGITMSELREGQRIRASVSFKTRGGRPAIYQVGSATWTSDNPAVASVVVDPANELQADIDGLDGSANTPVLITFKADGDPDADQVRDVVATLDIVVTQGEAVVAEIAAGTPADIPGTPPPPPPPPPPPAAPTISSVAPASGAVAGGDTVVVLGTGIATGATVTIGGAAATGVTVSPDGGTASVTTPAGTAGAVDVVVTNPDGGTATLTGGFTYV